MLGLSSWLGRGADDDDRPKQNISEYLGSITRLQGSLNTLSRSNIRSADSVQMQMVPRSLIMLSTVSTHYVGSKTTGRCLQTDINN